MIEFVCGWLLMVFGVEKIIRWFALRETKQKEERKKQEEIQTIR